MMVSLAVTRAFFLALALAPSASGLIAENPVAFAETGEQDQQAISSASEDEQEAISGASGGEGAAAEMIQRLTNLVEPTIQEGHLNDTTTVNTKLGSLETKAAGVRTAKEATNLPDTELDDCLLAQNGTLHTWKTCNTTLGEKKLKKESDCQAMLDGGVSTYTISEPEYTQGTGAEPEAICDFETFELEGATIGNCTAFLDDIEGKALAEFDKDYEAYGDLKDACEESTQNHTDQIGTCAQSRSTHRTKEGECDQKLTALNVKLCSFQAALKSKCEKLEQVQAEIADLAAIEAERNKELRLVALAKCLFDKYESTDQKCFDQEQCMSLVDGLSEKFATTAAETIQGFRNRASNQTQVGDYPCAAEDITIGTNGLSYSKINDDDEFSYMKTDAARVYSAAASGTLTPSVCIGDA